MDSREQHRPGADPDIIFYQDPTGRPGLMLDQHASCDTVIGAHDGDMLRYQAIGADRKPLAGAA
jgi:hypothetical protein